MKPTFLSKEMKSNTSPFAPQPDAWQRKRPLPGRTLIEGFASS